MNEKALINTLESLLIAASSFLILGLAWLVIYLNEPKQFSDQFTPKDFGSAPVFIREIHPKFEPIEQPHLAGYYEVRNQIESLDIFYLSIRTEYLGRFFITAYCPEECGWNGNNYPKGWQTASGVICHYSADPYTPTTCAIDPTTFGKFGDLYMIDGKIYVAEDTGAFRGFWIDCFVETMAEVQAWQTGYKSVYSVSYESKSLRAKERKNYHEFFSRLNMRRLCGYWCPAWCAD